MLPGSVNAARSTPVRTPSGGAPASIRAASARAGHRAAPAALADAAAGPATVLPKQRLTAGPTARARVLEGSLHEGLGRAESAVAGPASTVARELGLIAGAL
eukprot:4404496-Alexandrium_andersonii.AAC.1